ncbi:MAG: TolC family protein [Acidovorax sp.]|jgi:cobalt-zinc-cadmium efflux system outer membrane protein|nr:TolC family protein [Acidovorax sp.]
MKTVKSIAAAAALVVAGTCLAGPVAQAESMAQPSGPSAAALSARVSGDKALPASLGLVEFLSLVRSHHPALRAMPLVQGMEQADVRTAGTWQNPSVHYSRKPDEKEWGIEQPLPIFGQIGMRTEAARLAAATGQAERAVETQEVLSQAALRFAELLTAQQKLAAKQQAMQHLEQAAKVVLGQVELGARSKYDGARVELQRAQVQAQLEQQESETLAAQAALAEMLAQPQWSPKAIGSLLPAKAGQEEPSLDSMWQQASDRLPQLQAAHAKVTQTEQLVRQQAREALPTPTVGVARIRNRPDGDRYNQVGVSVELPLFDRKQGAIERARLEYAQAQLEEETAQQLARQRLQQAYTQRNLLRKTLRSFESRGLTQLDPLRQMAQDSYRLGQSSILEWLDAMESVADHQQQYLDLSLRVWQADWELNAARGQLPFSAE